MISPRTHGYVDYFSALLFFVAPSIWSMGTIATDVAYAIGTLVLFMALLTAYPLGIAKLIPFAFHWAVDLGLGALLIAMPWLVRFQDDGNARSFFIGVGAAGIVWTLLTRARHMPGPATYPKPAGA